VVASVVVYKCDLVCKLIKYIPVAAEGCQNRLAGSMSIEGFEPQLATLAWSWGRWMVRSKRGFGLPGDCSEMSLPFLWRNGCRIVHKLLINIGYGGVWEGSLGCPLFRIRVHCLVCVVHMLTVGYCFYCVWCVHGKSHLYTTAEATPHDNHATNLHLT